MTARLCHLLVFLPLLVAAGALAGRGEPPAGTGMMPVGDAYRPVVEITDRSATLQWFTATPQPTRVQIRAGGQPMNIFRPEGQEPYRPWDAGDVRIVEGEPGERTWHRLVIDDLEPATRHFYRIYDPAAEASERGRHWGADGTWRREFGFHTRAGEGEMTVVRLRIKVLLMPNVLDVASAHPPHAGDEVAELPEKLSDEQMNLIRAQYDEAARFTFINSGCRLWLDFDIVVDDRWQRWGEEPEDVEEAYAGWPVSRAWPGEAFRAPGGGAFTFVDMDDPEANHTEPIVEERPYVGQVEQAFLRIWDADAGRWNFRNSGGGTYGIDRFHIGHPARSQFLGGGDTAWLITHEVGHQIESHGRMSLADREDDQVPFNHPDPRRRRIVEGDDGPRLEVNPWSSSGRHGEHWDVIAHHYRSMTDTQWLRFHLGEPHATADADADGVPDDDPALPFDEKRFGSDPSKSKTDGRMDDLAKLQLSTWAPGPLQTTWDRPEPRSAPVDPRSTDQDGDGIPDDEDPLPLTGHPPFIWPISPELEAGDLAQWEDVPPAMTATAPQADEGDDVLSITFSHAHDADHYHGLLVIEGEWRSVRLTLDGEGEGYFATAGRDPQVGRGVVDLRIAPADGEEAATVRAVQGGHGLEHIARRDGERWVIQFRLPNGVTHENRQAAFFWRDGGREIGVALEYEDGGGTRRSAGDAYRLHYYRMLDHPTRGRAR